MSTLRFYIPVLISLCCGMLIEITAASSCSAAILDYRGRVFQDKKINSTDSISSVALSSVYGCREMCSREVGCIAVSYNTSEDEQLNCWLYNLTNIQSYIVPALESIVILLLPVECGQNSTANGGWSAWKATSECSTSCGSGVQSFNRSCTEPKPLCNGNECDGSDKKTDACNNTSCPDLVDQAIVFWNFEPIDGALPFELHYGDIQFDTERQSHVLAANGNGLAAMLGNFTGTCISDPSLCANGVTFSLWMKLLAPAPTTTNYPVFTTGGHTWRSLGFVLFVSGSTFQVSVRVPYLQHYVVVSVGDFTKWLHVVFTWTTSAELTIFLDGIPVGVTTHSKDHSNQHADTVTSFFVGAYDSVNSIYSIPMAIDDVLVIERKVDADEASALYSDS